MRLGCGGGGGAEQRPRARAGAERGEERLGWSPSCVPLLAIPSPVRASVLPFSRPDRRQDGRIQLRFAGREQVHLHPRYGARRPFARTGSAAKVAGEGALPSGRERGERDRGAPVLASEGRRARKRPEALPPCVGSGPCAAGPLTSVACKPANRSRCRPRRRTRVFPRSPDGHPEISEIPCPSTERLSPLVFLREGPENWDPALGHIALACHILPLKEQIACCFLRKRRGCQSFL